MGNFPRHCPKNLCRKDKRKDMEWSWQGATDKENDNYKYHQLYEEGNTEVDYLSLPSLVVALRKGITPAEIKSRVSSDIENSQNFTLQNGNIYLKSVHGPDTKICPSGRQIKGSS